jgi:Gluconate 2-dehydrogenase subunit 3
MDRRELLTLLAALPATTVLPLSPVVKERAARHAARALAAGGTPPAFFTPSEWETVRILSDLIIPRDEHSGSATEAGVPEFIDFVMTDEPDQQTPMRGGLAWLERESFRRYGNRLVACAPEQRTALLDQIAWPARARPEMAAGVAFFNRFRDLVCSGFYSSKEGVKDLQYQGNTVVVEWHGCPAEVIRKLGVK